MLKGNLSSFSLGEIFQSLAINNHTGTLKITGKDGSHKCIYFSRGEISLFSAGSPEALRIGEILIRQSKLSVENLKIALEEQKTTGELLGKVLTRKGLISREDIRAALETKIREEIYDLFLLPEAEFEFHINHLPEDVFDALQKNTRIAINTSAVIMEGLRRVDEWRLIQRRIKTFDEILIRVGSQPPGPGGAGHDLLLKLDGNTPVAELFQSYSGSRFECAKALCELVESGMARSLNLAEAVKAGERCLKAEDVPQALRFFRFADQLDPERPEVLKPLADCLTKLERKEEAAAVLRRAIRLYYQRKLHQEALELGEPFLSSRIEEEPEVAEMVFRSGLVLDRLQTARTGGMRMLSAALSVGDLAKAQEVLEELCRLYPKDLNLRIELAETYSKGGDRARAVANLEAVSKVLNTKRKLKELIRVLLLILEIDPQRADIRERTQKLMALQEKRDLRRQRRVTLLGAAICGLLFLALLPVLYEVKARELYAHAQRLEEISLASKNFSKAVAAYEELLSAYGFSSRAHEAKLALERMTTFERIRREHLDREKLAMEEGHRDKLKVLRRELPDLLKEAKRLEETGDIQRAFEVYTRVFSDFSEVPGARNLMFPLLITSSPSGAVVEVNGTSQGTTPLVVRASKGQDLTLILSRSGCELAQEKVTGGEKWQVHVSLQRRAIGELKISGAIQQALDARGERIFFPSRDGYLYAVMPGKREVAWRRKVGRFGDLLSEIGSTPGEILLGSVSGEVVAVSRDNGQARWKAQMRSAVLAPPVLSPDGRWVAAASVEGEVLVIDYSTGEPKGRFQAEDEIISAPAFVRELLLVGSADRHLYELEIPAATPSSATELSAGISAGLTPWEDSVLFATKDGSVHRYSVQAQRVLWSRALGAEASGPPVADSTRVFVGTAGGEVVAIDAQKGEISWTLRLTTGRVGRLTLGAGRLFAGTESGEMAAIVPATGAKDWSFQADSAITAPPLIAFGRIFLPSFSGKILMLEILE